MDLDDLQEALGGISYYQIGVIITVTGLTLGTACMAQTAAIFSAAPKFRCFIPILDNVTLHPEWTDEEITRLMVPEGDSCSRYDYDLSLCAAYGNLSCVTGLPNATIPCDHGYIYDKTYYTRTTVSEWDLVCSRVTLDSVAISLYFVGVLIGSMVIGPIMDWFGRKQSMLVGCCGTILAGIGVAFSPSYEVYIAMRVLVGIASTPCFMADFTYVIEMSPTKCRNAAAIYATAVTALAHLILPVFGMLIRDWRDLAICIACIPASYLVTYFFIPESPRWLIGKGRINDARKVVERYARSHKKPLNEDHWEAVVQTESDNVNKARANGGQKFTFRDLFRLPRMRTVSCLVIYLWCACSMVFYGLVLNVWRLSGNPHINGILNGSVELVSFGVLWVIFRYAGMRISCSITYFMSGFCCLLTMLLTQFSRGDEGMIAGAKWFALTGKLFATIMFAVIFKFTTELYPTLARGTALAMGSMAARIGTIILPFTLQLQMSVPWLTQTIFGIMGILGGVFSLLLPETSGVDLLSTFDQAENFYKKSMGISRLSGEKSRSGDGSSYAAAVISDNEEKIRSDTVL